MEILQGPRNQGSELARQVARDKAASKMEEDPKYFHPRGREHFHAEHGTPYPHPITPYEEALQKFQIKQRKVREGALKKSLNHKISSGG